MPLIEWPDDESARFMSIVMANMMVGSRLNIELFTAKHYYARDIHYITGIVETVKMVGIGRNSRNSIK